MKPIFKPVLSGMILVSAITFSGMTMAEDFSQLSNDDLFGMRDSIRSMDDASKDAYRTERQSRMMNMEQSEKEARFGDMGASGQRNMDRMSQKNRSGGGKGNGKGRGGQSGGGNKYRYGQDNDSGRGNQYRYGQGNDSGSGNQYRYGQGNDSGNGNQYRYGQGNSSGGYGGGQRYGRGR